ncbi:uncharacterized protein LOC122396863 [Colletes gigas]|uniref:uncharacterized protein LOC122396863 n=1 Tax=Colletes gigas TaxID=935657 RepID=UPI001C9A45CB|nr:uncharacterized protein LOC122396863 [Colletes gigas]
MRTIAIFLCYLCFVTCTLVRADDEHPRLMCLAKMGMTRADLPSLLTDDSEEAVRKRGCLEACFMQKIGIMEGNTINMDKIHAEIDKVLANSDQIETIHQSVHQCATDAADDDECIVAQKFAKCGLEYLKLRL